MGWRWTQSPMANDLIQHVYVMKSPKHHKRVGITELLGLVNVWKFGECWPPGKGWEAPSPFPPTLPFLSLTSAVPELCPFIMNW